MEKQTFVPVQLVIARDEEGNVRVQGSQMDKVTAYGMIQVAHEALALMFKQQESGIVPPSDIDRIRLGH